MSYYRRDVGGWRSFNLGRDMGLTCIGKLGRPVLLFPDGGPAEGFDSDGSGAGGAGAEGLGALQSLVDEGRFKLYIVDVLTRSREPKFDADDPQSAIALQQRYDHYIVDEVLPFIQHDCRHGGIHIVTLGFGAGAFHALNSACRHPHLFEAAIGLSGDYELEAMARAAGTPESYFQNPPAFLPGLDDMTFLPLLRGRSIFSLGASRSSSSEAFAASHMASVLQSKGLFTELELWDRPAHRGLWLERAAARLQWIAELQETALSASSESARS